MNREEMKSVIPHREPMLLVDRAEIEGEWCISQYTIRENEFFTQGHFPGNPIVPGVIQCEIMAQGSSLLMKDLLKDNLGLYAGLDKVKFKRTVRPGDTIVTKAKIVMQHGPLVVVEARATVDGELCCSGNLSFMLVPMEQAQKSDK